MYGFDACLSRHLYLQQMTAGAGGLRRIALDTVPRPGQLLIWRHYSSSCFQTQTRSGRCSVTLLPARSMFKHLPSCLVSRIDSSKHLTTLATPCNVVYSSDPSFCQLRIVIFIALSLHYHVKISEIKLRNGPRHLYDTRTVHCHNSHLINYAFSYLWNKLHYLYLSQYLTNLMNKICFTVSFISRLYMFRANVLVIRRSKLRYKASGIIRPIGGRLVLFHASTCFEQMCLSSGGQNCITKPLVSSHV